tara:strand:+ start:265 stop:453 length:189 start_codon:yes stop_codon:yes gene_type:complete
MSIRKTDQKPQNIVTTYQLSYFSPPVAVTLFVFIATYLYQTVILSEFFFKSKVRAAVGFPKI